MSGINTGDEVRSQLVRYHFNYSPQSVETRFRIIRSSFRDINFR